MINKQYTFTFVKSDNTEKLVELNVPINDVTVKQITCSGLKKGYVSSPTESRYFQTFDTSGYVYANITITKPDNFTITGYTCWMPTSNPYFAEINSVTGNQISLTVKYLGSSGYYYASGTLIGYTMSNFGEDSNVQDTLEGLFYQKASKIDLT